MTKVLCPSLMSLTRVLLAAGRSRWALEETRGGGLTLGSALRSMLVVK